MAKNILNDSKTFQVTIKYTSIFYYKAQFTHWDSGFENIASGNPAQTKEDPIQEPILRL
jgi:hypothetical protein